MPRCPCKGCPSSDSAWWGDKGQPSAVGCGIPPVLMVAWERSIHLAKTVRTAALSKVHPTQPSFPSSLFLGARFTLHSVMAPPASPRHVSQDISRTLTISWRVLLGGLQWIPGRNGLVISVCQARPVGGGGSWAEIWRKSISGGQKTKCKGHKAEKAWLVREAGRRTLSWNVVSEGRRVGRKVEKGKQSPNHVVSYGSGWWTWGSCSVW